MEDRFDIEGGLPKRETGIRALWVLYKKGQWGLLEDLGVCREQVEEGLIQFEVDNIILDRLTVAQAKRLVKKLPILEEAGIELRLHYALKQIDRGVRKG